MTAAAALIPLSQSASRGLLDKSECVAQQRSAAGLGTAIRSGHGAGAPEAIPLESLDTFLGWALTVIGVWEVVWGVSHLRQAGMPNPHLLYDAGYSRSRQAESIFFGVWTLMFAYWAFSKARQ